MLDELLGRAELKEQLATAEEELADLERRLEKESDRRREAVRDRQAAEERINQLEDRIAGLEGELERVKDDESGPTFYGVEDLERRRVREILDRLRSIRTSDEGALTAGVTDETPAAVREALGERSALVDRASPCVVCLDDASVIRIALTPPRHPGAFVEWADRFRLENGWFLPDGRFSFGLIRADLFALGVYEDAERVEYAGFETDVKSQHSKGGYSQARFERLRDEQIESHLDRCRDALDARATEPLVLVGDRRMLAKLDVEAAETAAVDASGAPKEALERAFRDFWRTRLYLL